MEQSSGRDKPTPFFYPAEMEDAFRLKSKAMTYMLFSISESEETKYLRWEKEVRMRIQPNQNYTHAKKIQ